MATVQVLVPCYNYGRYLDQCVDSVLAQEKVDVNVLIIDDCSTDNTAERCSALCERDRRVRVIRHMKNMGHIATYNEGISQIDGDYFVLLSADDLLAPGSLGRACALMEAHPNVGMTYGHAVSFEDHQSISPRTSKSGAIVRDGRTWIHQVCRSGKNFVICPEAVVRASIQRKLGGYDPDLPHSADMEMWLRIASISDIGYVYGADQAYYRVHPSSMQRTVHAGLLNDLIGRRGAVESAFQKEGARLKESGEFLDLACRSLALTAIARARKCCDVAEYSKDEASKYTEFSSSVFPKVVTMRTYKRLVAALDNKLSIWAKLTQIESRMWSFFVKFILRRIDYRWARRTGLRLPSSLLDGV
jgi:glycosyltransferase involved in cell wall biosynthesis